MAPNRGHYARKEKWAVIDKFNDIRVLFIGQDKAVKLAIKFNKMKMPGHPFRIGHVIVNEIEIPC